jgi:DNA-binding NtrC family response regulator
MARILVVEDEQKMRRLLCIMLGRRGHETHEAGDGREALELLQNQSYDVVISDIRMPHIDGMQLLKILKKRQVNIPLVFITAFATVDSAVDAMRQGAIDYITKPFDEARIHLTVERSLNTARILAENIRLREELKGISAADEIVYVSGTMSRVMDLARKVAEKDSAVLITGESGTGKELLARFIHQASARSAERFVPINCAAISPSLVESELFGHERGAFTGAEKRKLGKFEYGSKGTVFMDEIGDLPMEAQAKLLRVLQDKQIQRVGGNEEIPVDARVICATNQELGDLVSKGGFRRDLFYRINVFPIEMPPLRERKDDIRPLALHFLKRFSSFRETELTEGALQCLEAYPWPGNVRELSNAMERAAILARGEGKITSKTLAFLRDESAALRDEFGFSFDLPPDGLSLEDLETELVRQALERCGNNQSAAAKLLGLTRSKFRVLLRKETDNGPGDTDER